MWPHDILARFDHKQTSRPDTWRARCPMPSHSRGDPQRSLSIWIGARQPHCVCLGCWACRARYGGSHDYKKDILARVGLTMGDLFPPETRSVYDPDGRHQRRPVERVVAVYSYTDEHGEILYEKLRYEPKRFAQRRPDGAGGYANNIEGVRRVPFQLCELMARWATCGSWPVLIVEGERDVLSAESIGMLATCVTEGAGSGWDRLSPYPPFFRGRRCVIIRDEDAAGINHAIRVAGALIAGGARSVRLVALPVAYRDTDGLDLSDWIAAGGTREQLVSIIKAHPEYSA